MAKELHIEFGFYKGGTLWGYPTSLYLFHVIVTFVSGFLADWTCLNCIRAKPFTCLLFGFYKALPSCSGRERLKNLSNLKTTLGI